MSRVAGTIVFVVLATLAHAQQQPSEMPTEVDTVRIGQAVILSNVRGEIFKKLNGGSLTPVTSGASIEPGEILLVRKGASFSIGSTTFGPESHGDRWVQFQ